MVGIESLAPFKMALKQRLLATLPKLVRIGNFANNYSCYTSLTILLVIRVCNFCEEKKSNQRLFYEK